MFEPQFREPHKMASPREHDGYDGSYEQPPFLLAAVQAQSENEQENGNGPHIHRTCGERLRSPVEREGFHYLVKSGLPCFLEQPVCL